MRAPLLAIAIGLLLASGVAADDGAVESSPVRFVDAAPVGPTVAERLAVIRRRIQDATVYPPVARIQHLEGETLVRFDIDPQGTPQAVSVHRSSGAPSLDRAAEQAVVAAAPLPWVYGRLEVPVRFSLDDRR
jgi:TonB family protein